MSMKINILWFEDNEEWYETNKENIEDYLTNKNFIAEFAHYDSTDEMDKITAFCNYDLIFVDLKLDGQELFEGVYFSSRDDILFESKAE